jgi:hypothetical protein
MPEPEQTTAEPYLAAPVTDAKPMHLMKKYRPPAEKYIVDCGGVVQIDKQQETQQNEYKVDQCVTKNDRVLVGSKVFLTIYSSFES